MKIDRASFDKITSSKFWTKLKDSIVPFSTTPVKSKFLDELYLKYPELAPQFFKLKNKLTSNQQYSDAKLRAIDGLIELF